MLASFLQLGFYLQALRPATGKSKLWPGTVIKQIDSHKGGSLMTSEFVRRISLAIVIMSCQAEIADAQVQIASWLDQSKPASWNKPGLPIPAAPPVEGAIDSRCRAQARPAELENDRRLREKGWDLIGAYQGGWQILVIGVTAGYDGMCRPWQYQTFVFVGGVFAGTLSPAAMDSRTDGALSQVSLQANNRLTAQYARYTAKDAACCPSSRTNVVFEIAGDGPVLRPVSASTSPNK